MNDDAIKSAFLKSFSWPFVKDDITTAVENVAILLEPIERDLDDARSRVRLVCRYEIKQLLTIAESCQVARWRYDSVKSSD